MIGNIFRRFGEVLRDGVRIWWLAPLVPLLVLLPEAVQHVAEIDLGMFKSKTAFQALADDPRRMAFGYVKLAGLLLAILAAIRFWGALSRGTRWWNLRDIAWRNLILAMVLIALTTVPGTLLEPQIGAEKAGWIDIGLGLATLPLIALLVAGLIGDTETGLRRIFRTGWLAALRILVFAAAVWIPLQWLHGRNHAWALGQPDGLVWALMAFDSLVVGLLAVMAGTAIHHGYRGLGEHKEGTPL